MKNRMKKKIVRVYLIISHLSTSHAFPAFRLLTGNDYSVAVSIMQLARLNAWIATKLTSLEQRVERGGLGQKLHVNTSTNYVSRTVNQLIEQVYTFLQIWEHEELQLSSENNCCKSKENEM